MEFTFQIILASILGLAIGFNRLKAGKLAGPRTYAFVALGSTLFTILSQDAFQGDDTRIAAQIITGVGFIGAGMILHQTNQIQGLTTAAGLWAIAAVGMAIGTGWYVQACIVTAIMLLLLSWNDKK
jgi:putative Mg2+ transporter-C (MgtC) family protein